MTAPQLAANRANALLSTGPRTESGRRRSSQNPVKHGLCGKTHAATPAEQEAYDRHCRLIHEALSPVGIMETELTHEIAGDRWRLKRARALENSIFAQGPQSPTPGAETGNPEIDAALAAGQTWIEQSRNLQLLTLYEQRINRTLAKNTAKLEAVQAARKAPYAQAQQEAMLLTGLAHSKGETYDPAPDFPPSGYFGGFAYVSIEIVRLIQHETRLEEAFAHRQPTAIRPAARKHAA